MKTFKGYWPDEYNSKGELCETVDYNPWEDFSFMLWGEEAGDFIKDEDDITLLLKKAGYKIVKIEGEV